MCVRMMATAPLMVGMLVFFHLNIGGHYDEAPIANATFRNHRLAELAYRLGIATQNVELKTGLVIEVHVHR